MKCIVSDLTGFFGKNIPFAMKEIHIFTVVCMYICISFTLCYKSIMLHSQKLERIFGIISRNSEAL